MEEEKRSHWIFIGLISVLVILGIMAFWQLSKVHRLEVELTQISIEQRSQTSFRIGFTLVMFNPNPVEVTVDQFSAGVYANDIYLTDVGLKEPIVLSALHGTQKRFSIDVDLVEFDQTFIEIIRSGSVSWKIQGEYLLRLPFGLTFPYQFTTYGQL